MVRLILNLCVAAILLVSLIALIRARHARQHHDISVKEIHPDLAAGEELVQEELKERRRQESPCAHPKSEDG